MRGGDFMASATRHNSDEPWSNADQFFLTSALSRGMSLAEAAGFLGRTEDEVGKRAALITAARLQHRRRIVHRCKPLTKTVAASKAVV
jgi:hypothetical protein